MGRGEIWGGALRYAAVAGVDPGNGAVIIASEEDREGREVVREHQCHTTSIAEVSVRRERPWRKLATCTRR